MFFPIQFLIVTTWAVEKSNVELTRKLARWYYFTNKQKDDDGNNKDCRKVEDWSMVVAEALRHRSFDKVRELSEIAIILIPLVIGSYDYGSHEIRENWVSTIFTCVVAFGAPSVPDSFGIVEWFSKYLAECDYYGVKPTQYWINNSFSAVRDCLRELFSAGYRPRSEPTSFLSTSIPSLNAILSLDNGCAILEFDHLPNFANFYKTWKLCNASALPNKLETCAILESSNDVVKALGANLSRKDHERLLHFYFAAHDADAECCVPKLFHKQDDAEEVLPLIHSFIVETVRSHLVPQLISPIVDLVLSSIY